MSDYDSNDEANYDSDAISNRLNDSESEEEYKIDKYTLFDRKIKNLLSFNADGIDIDQYFRSLKKITEDEESPHFIFLDYPNNDLVNKEYQLSTLLNLYNEKIKETGKPGIMDDDQVKELVGLYNEINDLRDEYLESEDDDEPLLSGTLDEKIETLIHEERKALIEIAKDINRLNKRRIFKIPPGNSIDSEAYNNFYKKVSNSFYTGHNINNRNTGITSLKTEWSDYSQLEKSKLEQILEFKKDLGKPFAIKVSNKEKEYFSKRDLLKKLMMKMNENDLIGCAIHAEVYYDFEKTKEKERYQLSPSIIEKIRNLKQNKIDTKPVITSVLRRVSLEKLKKEFNNPLVNNIESDIFELTHNDYNEYSNKVNDIVFILSEYPRFKILLYS